MVPRRLAWGSMPLRRLVLLTALLLAVPAAPALATMSLAEVPLSSDFHEVGLLERAGFDVTHDVTAERAVVAIEDAGELARLGRLVPYTFQIEYYTAFLARSRAADQRAALAAPRSALPTGRDTYRLPAEYDAELDALATGHPGLVREVRLGVSFEGREIRGVEIAKDVNRSDDGRPVYVVMGLHHAREWPSAEVNMEFAHDLVDHVADPRIQALLEKVRVFVVPVVNPDGFQVSRGGEKADQRKNCKPMGATDAVLPCGRRLSTDLNRNYGAYWGGNGAASDPNDETYRGPGPWSEPESRAVHEFSQRLQITNFQTLHNVAALVLRPPGFASQGLAPDEPALKSLGDRMAAATGYESRYGYQLYEVTGATEDWNYASQNAFGYTIELGGTGFQGPYAENVVDQYVGKAGTATAGKGAREALLLAGEQAGDPAGHSVLAGSAPAGSTLRLRKDFLTDTSPVCVAGALANGVDCGARGPVQQLPDFLESTLTVPASGHYEWHVNPSTRPFKRATPERWTLSCERAGRTTATQPVVVALGERKDVDPCRASGSGGAAGTNGSVGGQGSAGSAGGAAATGSTRTASLAVDRTRRRRALSRGVRVRVRCSAACVATGRLRLGPATIAKGTTRLAAAGRRTFTLRVTAAGRRSLRRHPRASLVLQATGAIGGRVVRTLRRSLVL